MVTNALAMRPGLLPGPRQTKLEGREAKREGEARKEEMEGDRRSEKEIWRGKRREREKEGTEEGGQKYGYTPYSFSS